MIRLYVDRDFEVGAELKLPADELRYFKSVRRGQGEVRLFNRAGQEAVGVINGSIFSILDVKKIDVPTYNLSIGVGMPESSMIPQIIRSLSELGAAEVFFFLADRSQRFKNQTALKALEIRWGRIAIESARQCGRPRPLDVSMKDWRTEEFTSSFDGRFLMDESSVKEKQAPLAKMTKIQRILILVGCEGGWTQEERDTARQRGFASVHFHTPILRVETAAVCAGFYGMQLLGGGEGG